MPRTSLEIAIIDYDMGNVKSIENAIKHICNYSIVVTADHDRIRQADALILPGVGAYRDAMEHLRKRNLIDILNDEALNKKKIILGICLGMQMLFESSEEGGLNKGLGWIPGTVERLNPGGDLRVPHMGWNNIEIAGEPPLLAGLGEEKDFYFVHSYHANCPAEFVTSRFEYGQHYTASVAKGNIMGAQFHPEKSQGNGFTLLRNFVAIVEEAKKGA